MEKRFFCTVLTAEAVKPVGNIKMHDIYGGKPVLIAQMCPKTN